MGGGGGGGGGGLAKHCGLGHSGFEPFIIIIIKIISKTNNYCILLAKLSSSCRLKH